MLPSKRFLGITWRRSNQDILGVEKQTASDILVLIPIKEISETKMRIKNALNSTQIYAINSLVKTTFNRTLNIIQRMKLSFGVISPSQEIIDYSLEVGADFTFIDGGTDLNNALSQAIKRLPPEQKLLIIMPDLPFFSVNCLQEVLKSTQDAELVIVPSISGEGEKKGTAMLYMYRTELLSFCFGTRSKDRFIQSAQKNRVEYEILNLDPCGRDLDTSSDLKYLQKNLLTVNDPEIYIEILEQLFH